MRKNVFLIFLVLMLLFAINGCDIGLIGKDPTAPDDPVGPKWVEVEVKYQRAYDNLDVCPALHADDPIYDDKVYLQGFIGRNPKMEKIAEDLFNIRLSEKKCQVNYLYNITVLDNVWFDSSTQENGCYKRAHNVWFNGYRVPRDAIHKEGNGEYLRVRFDEDGVPHFK